MECPERGRLPTLLNQENWDKDDFVCVSMCLRFRKSEGNNEFTLFFTLLSVNNQRQFLFTHRHKRTDPICHGLYMVSYSQITFSKFGHLLYRRMLYCTDIISMLKIIQLD